MHAAFEQANRARHGAPGAALTTLPTAANIADQMLGAEDGGCDAAARRDAGAVGGRPNMSDERALSLRLSRVVNLEALIPTLANNGSASAVS